MGQLELTIGALQVSKTGVDTGYTIQASVDGLDAPDYRESTYDKPGEDGAVLSSLFYSSRVLSFPGQITRSTAIAYETLRQALVAACAIARDSSNRPTPTVLTITTPGGSTYVCNAYPRKPVLPVENNSTGSFLLNFIVPDGLLYSSSAVLSGSITRPIGGGFTVPFTTPFTLAASSGGSVTLNNPGNTPSYPVITLTGPLTSPFLANSATGTFMQLNYTIAAGNTVVIDMANKTVMLNGNSSILGVKTSDSDWWPIKPGSNTISLSTSSSSDTGNAQLQYYPAYLGL